MERLTLLLNLKRLRTEAGIQVKDVAANCGVPLPAYRVVEGGATPSLETALKVARYLELQVEEIWGLREDEPPAIAPDADQTDEGDETADD